MSFLNTLPPTRGLYLLVFFHNTQMFTITFRSPYTQELRTQSFASRKEALDMIAFYASCGTRAQLV